MHVAVKNLDPAEREADGRLARERVLDRTGRNRPATDQETQPQGKRLGPLVTFQRTLHEVCSREEPIGFPIVLREVDLAAHQCGGRVDDYFFTVLTRAEIIHRMDAALPAFGAGRRHPFERNVRRGIHLLLRIHDQHHAYDVRVSDLEEVGRTVPLEAKASEDFVLLIVDEPNRAFHGRRNDALSGALQTLDSEERVAQVHLDDLAGCQVDLDDGRGAAIVPPEGGVDELTIDGAVATREPRLQVGTLRNRSLSLDSQDPQPHVVVNAASPFVAETGGLELTRSHCRGQARLLLLTLLGWTHVGEQLEAVTHEQHVLQGEDADCRPLVRTEPQPGLRSAEQKSNLQRTDPRPSMLVGKLGGGVGNEGNCGDHHQTNRRRNGSRWGNDGNGS